MEEERGGEGGREKVNVGGGEGGGWRKEEIQEEDVWMLASQGDAGR